MTLVEKFLKAAPTLAKIGKFLHLVEDDLAHVSMSGIQLWAATYVNIQQLWYSHDHITQAVAAASNAAAGALHAVKRGQVITAASGAAPAPEGPPPWTGEAD